MSEIAPQASLFVPLTIPQTMLPNYVMIDTKSRWHVGGLLSTAYETMTLPSRLRLGNGSRASLDELVNVLNVNGNQNIAKVRMSIDQKDAPNGHHGSARLKIRAQSRDTRMPSQERRSETESFSQADQELKTFDMDFFPSEVNEQSRGQRAVKEPHVFGQAETHRADDQKENEIGETAEEAGHERARRRAAGLPIIQRSVRPFPCSVSISLSKSGPISYLRAIPRISPNFLIMILDAYQSKSAGPEYPCLIPCLTAFPTSLLIVARHLR